MLGMSDIHVHVCIYTPTYIMVLVCSDSNLGHVGPSLVVNKTYYDLHVGVLCSASDLGHSGPGTVPLNHPELLPVGQRADPGV